MAVNAFRNRLLDYTNNPGSYTGSPGFQFQMDAGTQALNRRAAASGNRGSGNALADLVRYGTGLAAQDYGNEFNRMNAAAGTQDQFDLGSEQNATTRDLGMGRLGLDRELGTGRLALDNRSLDANTALGQGRLGLDTELGRANVDTARRGQNFDYSLGEGRLANDYTLGMGQQATTRRGQDYDFTLGMGRNANDAYNGRTARGTAQSNAWYQGQQFAPPQEYDMGNGRTYTRFYGGR